MATANKAVTMYLEDQVYAQLKKFADQENRSVSQTAALIITHDLFDSTGAKYKGRYAELGDRPGPEPTARQVDLEEQIAEIVKRGPMQTKEHKGSVSRRGERLRRVAARLAKQN